MFNSHQKLFCNCSYKKPETSFKEVFSVQYPSENKQFSYEHDSHYCEYEKEERPPQINKKVVDRAVNKGLELVYKEILKN